MTEAAPTRFERRKSRTRASLVRAARQIMSEGRATSASIHDIAETADIGFGSFYNHFATKDELYRVAAQEVLEEWGSLVDGVTAGIEDPREVFAVSLRVTGRLAWTHEEIARVITHVGFGFVDLEQGLAPRAMRDLVAAREAGRVEVDDLPLTLSMIAGAIVGMLTLRRDHPDLVSEASADEMAEQVLRMVGVPTQDAHELVGRPLPATAPA